jgi:Ankyrin repeats (3 copies)
MIELILNICSMSSCNKFSESIVHMACRKASFEVAEFILANGGDSNIVDDYGRTPLHDACWRMEPRFDIVTLLLDSNLELLRIVDIRGSTPLKYVREEHWVQWCAYFYHQKDKYWQPRSENNRECKRTRNS